MSRFAVLLVALGASTASAGTAPPPCSTGSVHRGQLGQVFSCECPDDFPIREVWGTGVYTDDSDLCTAALHGSAVTPSGGLVEYEVVVGEREYFSSNRNGVRTGDWESWQGSIRFVK